MSAAIWTARAGSLVRAGLPSHRVLELLGPPVTTAADGGAVQVAWELCVDRGAALSAVLNACERSALEWERLAAERVAALAGPRATARLLAALPFAVLVLGMLLGVNVVGTLVTTVPGWFCLAIGALCQLLGWCWIRRLLRRAAVAEPAPGFNCEIVAQLVSSGVPLATATAAVDLRWPFGSAARNHALAFADEAGLPPVATLQAEAGLERITAARLALIRAHELAVRLTLPLGCCILPAFIAWGVIPLLLSVIGSLSLATPSHP